MPQTGDGERNWLIGQCGRYRKHLLAKKVVTEGEMDECQPPDDAPFRPWIEFYGQLRAWLWVQDDVPGSREEAEENALKALREAPESVVLSDGSGVTVYPKGLDALLWLHVRQRILSDLNRKTNGILEQIADGGESLPREVLEAPATTIGRAAREMAHQIAVIHAVVCHPGPGLPKWAESDARPPEGRIRRIPWKLSRKLKRDPVARFIDLDPVDMIALNRAYKHVNAGRLAMLNLIAPPRTRPGKPGSEVSYSVFISSMAMRTGQNADYLARDRSLVALVTQVRLAQPPPLEEEMEAAG